MLSFHFLMGKYKDISYKKYYRPSDYWESYIDSLDYKLSKNLIHKGLTSLPPQDLSWSCGPESALRSLAMWKNTRDYTYYNFISRCPKTIPDLINGIAVGPSP